ncbi:MAG TPA: hypothetical protein VMU60_06755 [Syntrophobacteria bacterium]|nr:hypothetical protein [Syntrophobacteria bacterium]
MQRITISVLLVLGLLGWSNFAPAQQKYMLALQSRNESPIEVGEVICEFGEESGAKIPVSWKVNLTNKNPKDHTVDVQVRFLDAQKAEAFHDSVMGSKVPANGTLAVSHTITVDATKARSVKSVEASATKKR